MTGPSREQPNAPDGFDPYRRRREIELMEQRFRERAERNGGGPLQTGEIDDRVASEMQQFFTESHEQLQRVVPGLEEQPGAGMKETTGEIRRKIDDFFAQVKDAGGGTSVNTQEIAKRKPRWSGMFPDQPFDKPVPAGAAQPNASSGREHGGERSSSGHPGAGSSHPGTSRDAGARRPPYTSQPSASAPQVSVPRPAASPPVVSTPMVPRPSESDAEQDRPRMDLKTALERLKRHGVVKSETGGSPHASVAPPPSMPSAMPSVGAQAPGSGSSGPPSVSIRTIPSAGQPQPGLSQAGPRMSQAPARPAPPAPPASADTQTATNTVPPTFAPRRDPTRGSLPSIRPDVRADVRADGAPPRRDPSRTSLPPMRQATNVSLPRGGESVVPQQQPGAQRPAAAGPSQSVPAQTPPAQRSVIGAAAQPAQRPASSSRAPSDPAPPAIKSARDPIVLPPARGLPAPGRGARPQNRIVDAPPVDRALPRRPATADEEPAQARRAESPIKIVRPRSNLGAGDVESPVGAPGSSRGPASSQASDAGVAFDSIFNELEGLVRDTLKDSVDQSFEAARVAETEILRERPVTGPVRLPKAGPASVPVHELDAEDASSSPDDRAAAAPDQRNLQRPSDDEENEGEAPAEESPAGPYNWGVKPARRPPGAWLVEGEEAGSAPPSARPGREASGEQASALPARQPESAQRAAPAADPSGGSGGVGGRGYLVKKLSDEVKRVQPAIHALRAKGVVSGEDLGDEASQGGDDDLSIDQFRDRSAIDFEKELSPVRLVEELRRIRRLMEALVARGVLTPEDLEKASGE